MLTFGDTAAASVWYVEKHFTNFMKTPVDLISVWKCDYQKCYF